MKTAILCLAVVLAGCAAAPKPQMPDTEYTSIGGLWVAAQRCGQLGLMDPATAAHGMRYQTNKLSLYTYDQQRLDTLTRHYQGEKENPTAAQCNTLAVTINSIRQREVQNTASAQANQQAWVDTLNNQPKRTYCSQVGTQTMCSTY